MNDVLAARLAQFGLEPCNELLRCVKADSCSQCEPNAGPPLELGKIYRATGWDPRERAWFLDGMSVFVGEDVDELVLLYCEPHFGKFEEGSEDAQTLARIRSAARRGGTAPAPEEDPLEDLRETARVKIRPRSQRTTEEAK